MQPKPMQRMPMRRRNILAVTLIVMACLLLPTLSRSAEPNDGREKTHLDEIIVLLAAGENAPAPEQVVTGIHDKSGLDQSFLAGNPKGARLALTHRATGALAERLAREPDSPRARLERYVVLEYPEGVDLDAVMAVLAAHPRVLHVEKNRLFSLSAVSVDDPFFPEQWGHPMLQVPEAWERTEGHAFVGLIDTGLQVDHPDLRAFGAHEERIITGDDGAPRTVCGYQDGTFEGGNFRPHLSWDFWNQDCNVDELEDISDPDPEDDPAGHGTHVAGIVGATGDNGEGVTGVCRHCSVMMAKFNHRGTEEAALDTGADALHFLIQGGAQVASMSWGIAGLDCSGAQNELGIFCQALALAEERDLTLMAAPGNDKTDIEFPASDPRVLSIGGIESDGEFWDEADDEGCPYSGTIECGSNFTSTPGSAQQDLVAPAQEVLSTMYQGYDSNCRLGCGDSTHPGVGYGFCTGTSMSSPYVAGVAGLLRSLNPLLDKNEIRDALITNSDRAGAWDPKFGYGVPDAAASADAVLGTVVGEVLPNRLTPLFDLYSPDAESHLSTTVPQMAAAAVRGTEVYFSPGVPAPVVAPLVAGYTEFPGAGCIIGPCSDQPRAWVHLFTTHTPPFAGAPPLVPLYRMSFDEPWNGNLANRSFFYTTEEEGIVRFKEVGYELDGIEGYLFRRCTPEPACIPQGAVRLYRLYHLERDDYALFPESQEQAFRNAGYISQSTLNDWIGYVYPNADADGDRVVDGFELVAGTDPQVADSDCDGASDGEELLDYDSDGYGDPLEGPCAAGDLHVADSFTGDGPLDGRLTEIGAAAWTARPGAEVIAGRVRDSAAVGGLPFDPATLRGEPVVTLSAGVDPTSSPWVGVGFASQATAAYPTAGALWTLLRENGTYTVRDGSGPLASGTIPGTATGGFHRVEIEYDVATNRAAFRLNGVEVHSQVLAAVPDIRFAGFEMRRAAEGGARLDDLQLTTARAVLLSDTFAGKGSLDGRQAEVGGVWSARRGAVVDGDRVVDSAAIGGVPFDLGGLAGDRVVVVRGDVDPTASGWVGLGFASEAAKAYWASGELWALLRESGTYSLHDGNGPLASGAIPGPLAGGYHEMEIEYHTGSRRAVLRIDGSEVYSGILAAAPDIRFAGFHMHGAGGGKLDDFEVQATVVP